MGVGDQPVAVVRNHADEPAELGRQFSQLGLADPSAGGPDGLALQGAPKAVEVADLPSPHAPDDGPAVGTDLDDTDPRQGDQRLTDRRPAHAQAFRQFLDDQPLPGPEAAVHDILEQILDERLPP